jgi:DNA-binding response OmpR family regulator
MHTRRILLVEDEPVTRLMLEARLRGASYEVQSVPSGEAALRLLAQGSFALMLTDLHLDAMDGVHLMARARAMDPDLELIVLTGVASIDSAIAALDYGAHAYLRKPVAAGELEARVAAALARRQARREGQATIAQLTSVLARMVEPQIVPAAATPAAEATLQVAGLELDLRRRRVRVSGRLVALSQVQFDLLLYLARRADTVHSPEQLAAEVLGLRCAQDEARELIKATVHRLRSKIEADARAPRVLLTVRGAGYMLSTED